MCAAPFQSLLSAAGLALALSAVPALAHVGGGGLGGGLAAGFLHPFSGLDHIVAMVAVGLWAALIGTPAIVLLPIVFPLVMAAGGAAGGAGIPLPAVEIAIALSAMVLGAMVLFRARPPIWIAASLVGAFGLFHGHAHGAELPSNAGPVGYAAGFLLATGLLHLAGIGCGLMARRPAGSVAVQVGGGLVSLVGLGFLLGAA